MKTNISIEQEKPVIIIDTPLQPSFELCSIGNNCYVINDRGRTVAIVTSQGYIDWLLRSPEQPGELLTAIRKETHLCYTLGLKLLLVTPTPDTVLREFSYRSEADGARLVLIGHSVAPDGNFTAKTTAVLAVNAASGQYEWTLQTTLICTASESVPLVGIEFNNVYPGKTGRCMLYTPQKEYAYTLMTDRDGVVWRFPHQHMLHYSQLIDKLHFANGTLAGYFGEPAPAGFPVVVIEDSPLPPDWGICDMYYDLHCMARTTGVAAPGERWTFSYVVKYLNAAEGEQLLAASRPIPISAEIRAAHTYPRFELGVNTFSAPVAIDDVDDISGFRENPPVRVWDREVHGQGSGSLRITNSEPRQTCWYSEPPTQIPPGTRLNINARVKVQDVRGKGAFLRLRYYTYVWHPTPHVEYLTDMESSALNGSNDGWVTLQLPELRVPPEHFDYLLDFIIELDGEGTAWFTDISVELQGE